jgi:hypothetical protein
MIGIHDSLASLIGLLDFPVDMIVFLLRSFLRSSIDGARLVLVLTVEDEMKSDRLC